MKPHTAILLAALIVVGPAALANPCALPGQFQALGSGIGGTGHGSEGSGMGGTGVEADLGGMGGTGHRNDGSGMGGTGTQADGGMGGTGVVGVITGFGSICVNGLELHYDADTPVLVDGEKKTPEHLAIGQLVAVQAEGQGQSLKARQIAVSPMLAGPVSWVSPSGNSFVALGQTVHLDAAQTTGPAGNTWSPKVGDHVRVNGLPESGGVVRATSVEAIAPGSRVSLQGKVASAGSGIARIGGMVVTAAGSVRGGDYVRVSGRLVEGVLRAEQIDMGAGLNMSASTERVVLQGVAHRALGPGVVSLGYADIRMPPGVNSERVARPGEVLRVEAERRPDGVLEARGLVIDRPIRREFDSRPGRDESARSERHEREQGERPEREGGKEYSRPEKPERNDREDGPEKIERPERAERPEKPEKPELPERIEFERPELPERPERDDD